MTGKFSFHVAWIDEVEGEQVDTALYLRAILNDREVWPVAGGEGPGLDAFADELLSYLSDFWQPLNLREVPPLPLKSGRPTDFRREAARRWSEMSEGDVEREDELLWNFEEAHNLARAFGGQSDVPPLWFIRQRSEMTIDTARFQYRVTLREFVEAITMLGDVLASRLAERQPGRWGALLKAWSNRDLGDPVRLQSLATSIDGETTRELIALDLIAAPGSVTEAANDNSELKAAARMVGALPPAQIRKVLETVRGFEPRVVPALEDLSSTVRTALVEHLSVMKPYQQGVFAARTVRMVRSIGETDTVDPFEILRELGVAVSTPSLGLALSTLEALSIWGDFHGPAVLINAQSRRLGSVKNVDPGTRPETRVTAAHELCHLLLDRDGTLGVVDVLDGRMPISVEQRARAFAAELLLPSNAAARHWRTSTLRSSATGVKQAIAELGGMYGVSKSVARWQLGHGLDGSEPVTAFWLNTLFPERSYT